MSLLSICILVTAVISAATLIYWFTRTKPNSETAEAIAPKEIERLVAIQSDMSLKYKDFDIEFLPYSQRYYPRYKGKYIFYWSSLQSYDLHRDKSGCEYRNSKEKCKEVMEQYLDFIGVSSEILKITEDDFKPKKMESMFEIHIPKAKVSARMIE